MFLIPDFNELWPDLKQWQRREIGRELRRLGLSLGEIRHLIPVTQTTLSGWCRGIDLTEEQLQRIRSIGRDAEATERRASARRRTYSRRRAALRAAGVAEAEPLIEDPFWVAGTVAYWAEGAKRDNMLSFSNSDPAMVRLFIDWGERYLGLTRERFTMRLHLHSGQCEEERQAFWSAATGIPLDQFRRGFIKPEGTGHRKNVLYNGTAQTRVTRSTALMHRVLGWIDVLQGRWASLDCSTGR